MRRAVVVLLLLVANIVFGSEPPGSGGARSDVAAPETATGKLFQRWLTVCNAADKAAPRLFLEGLYASEARGDVPRSRSRTVRCRDGWTLATTAALRMNAELSILWNEVYLVAVSANMDPPMAENAAQYATDRLL